MKTCKNLLLTLILTESVVFSGLAQAGQEYICPTSFQQPNPGSAYQAIDATFADHGTVCSHQSNGRCYMNSEPTTEPKFVGGNYIAGSTYYCFYTNTTVMMQNIPNYTTCKFNDGTPAQYPCKGTTVRTCAIICGE